MKANLIDIRIETVNADFEDDPEGATNHVLNQIKDAVRKYGINGRQYHHTVFDRNGNTVGLVRVIHSTEAG